MQTADNKKAEMKFTFFSRAAKVYMNIPTIVWNNQDKIWATAN